MSIQEQQKELSQTVLSTSATTTIDFSSYLSPSQYRNYSSFLLDPAEKAFHLNNTQNKNKIGKSQSKPSHTGIFDPIPPPKFSHVPYTCEESYKAAGLLPYIFTGDDVLVLLGLERRSDQGLCLTICGGKRDKTDYSSLHTAVREFEEETGDLLQYWLGRDLIWNFDPDNNSALPHLLPFLSQGPVNPQDNSQIGEIPITSDQSFHWASGKYIIHLQSCGNVSHPEHTMCTNTNAAIHFLNFIYTPTNYPYFYSNLMWTWGNYLMTGGLCNQLYFNLPSSYCINNLYSPLVSAVKQTEEVSPVKIDHSDYEKVIFLLQSLGRGPGSTNKNVKMSQNASSDLVRETKKTEEIIHVDTMNDIQAVNAPTADEVISPTTGTSLPKKQTFAKVNHEITTNKLRSHKHKSSKRIYQPRLVYPQFPITHMGLEHYPPPECLTQEEYSDFLLKTQSNTNAFIQNSVQSELAMSMGMYMNMSRPDHENNYEGDTYNINQPQPFIGNFYDDSDDDNMTTDDNTMNNNESNDSLSSTPYTYDFTTPTITSQNKELFELKPQSSIRSLLCYLLPLVHQYKQNIRNITTKSPRNTVNTSLTDFYPSYIHRSLLGHYLFAEQYPEETHADAEDIVNMILNNSNNNTDPTTAEADEALWKKKRDIILNALLNADPFFHPNEGEAVNEEDNNTFCQLREVFEKYNFHLSPKQQQLFKALLNQRISQHLIFTTCNLATHDNKNPLENYSKSFIPSDETSTTTAGNSGAANPNDVDALHTDKKPRNNDSVPLTNSFAELENSSQFDFLLDQYHTTSFIDRCLNPTTEAATTAEEQLAHIYSFFHINKATIDGNQQVTMIDKLRYLASLQRFVTLKMASIHVTHSIEDHNPLFPSHADEKNTKPGKQSQNTRKKLPKIPQNDAIALQALQQAKREEIEGEADQEFNNYPNMTDDFGTFEMDYSAEVESHAMIQEQLYEEKVEQLQQKLEENDDGAVEEAFNRHLPKSTPLSVIFTPSPQTNAPQQSPKKQDETPVEGDSSKKQKQCRHQPTVVDSDDVLCDVGYDSMLSLHWVSVKGLLLSGFLLPCTPYAHELVQRSQSSFSDSEQSIKDCINAKSLYTNNTDMFYNPLSSPTYFALQNYQQLLSSFLGKSISNDVNTRLSVVTSTGFVFPTSRVLWQTFRDAASGLPTFFCKLLQYRSHMVEIERFRDSLLYEQYNNALSGKHQTLFKQLMQLVISQQQQQQQ